MTTSDFPIPAGLEGFWVWDKMHFPRPQTPLTAEVIVPAFGQGFSRAMDEFASPFGMKAFVLNCYAFDGLVPLATGKETPEARGARYKEVVERMVPRIGELWRNEWLPSILPGLEKAKSIDYPSLSDDQLLLTFEELRRDAVNRWVVHGRINYVTVAASWFADFYNENLAPADPTEAYIALQGFHTLSVDAGKGLWRLRGLIKSSPALTKAFEELAPRELIHNLEGSEEGRRFLGEFRSYLDEFGWRSDVFELADPSWLEDPSIPLNTLQGFLILGEDGDPEVHFRRAVQRREELLAQARAQLAGSPEKLARFNQLYEAARHYLNVTEDHNYYIDQIGVTVLRLPILEMGRRLAAKGCLEQVDDVFMLYLQDIRDGLAGMDQRRLAATRRAEIERWSRVVPVPVIGQMPPVGDDPFVEAVLVKMFGAPPEPSRDPSVINGIAASPGTVQARAKVVRNLSEASKLLPGDIMVCEMTMPPWTPLFATVSGLVADTGGVLSHCAIVAREYRLPAVVGTIFGTNVIKDGMLITVDGSKGIVRIESRT